MKSELNKIAYYMQDNKIKASLIIGIQTTEYFDSTDEEDKVIVEKFYLLAGGIGGWIPEENIFFDKNELIKHISND